MGKMKPFNDLYRNRRVLVTGHTGFKGSWLTLWLEHLGATVAGYSLDIPTIPSNFALLGLKERIKHYVGDVRDRKRLAEVMDEFRPAVVFHLAAQALVRRSYADPLSTFETNTMGMANVLECIRERPSIDVAVVITSDKAYRNDEWVWGYRETDALGGRDPYSGSKGCAELVAHSYFQSFLSQGTTQFAITRAGNVIGGGDWAEDRIVPDSIKAWSIDAPVSVRRPKATRPWQHVLEPLSGYLWLGARLQERGSGLNGEPFNFGPAAHVDQTVEALIDAMAARWPGAKWHVPAGNEQDGHEATLLKLSCDKALFHLAWRAALEFPETVELTIDWYRTWHQKSDNLLDFTIGQIEQYTTRACERGIAWTGHGG